MPNYRRYYVAGRAVFLTTVTRDRVPYLRPSPDAELLLETMRSVRAIRRFALLAYAILPDHFYLLIRTERGSDTFSAVMHSIKRNYTAKYKRAHSIAAPIILWQPRFWDHIIRDEDDLARHLDYVHWNPVKHGYVERPGDWPHTTFRQWAERGFYAQGWGEMGEPNSTSSMECE